jgi:hypothetical protein
VNHLNEIYDKIIKNLKESASQIYLVLFILKKLKIECCNILNHIATSCEKNKDNKKLFYRSDIIKSLEFSCKDRVKKVQLIANQTLKLWQEVFREKINNEEIPNDDIVENDNEKIKNSEITELKGNAENSNKLSKLNMLRNMSKIKKQSEQESNNLLTNDDIYEKGIGSVIRTNNFLNSRNENNMNN